MNTVEQKKKKVLVALSGGVDSSVSAALLQEEGYEVHGAFIKTWSAPWLPCTWREERRDAMRVAAALHIPFYTIDLEKEYERDVVNYLVSEYRVGRTPNPDVMCNKYVKFGGFFGWAMEQGYDAVATGHYAQVLKNKDGIFEMHAGKDEKKDQTYFLWTLTQKQLAKTLFPVGGFEKRHVRELAEQFHLPTATKKDSQGVCFLGKVDMKDFLKHYIDEQEGKVLNTDGGEIGYHDGAVFLTLGQRHGFTITKKTPDTPPLYVYAKDVANNTVTVAPKGYMSTQNDTNKEIAFMGTNLIREGVEVTYARLRYNQPLFAVTVTFSEGGTGTAYLDVPQEFIPRGQSLVFYTDTECLGGAVIA